MLLINAGSQATWKTTGNGYTADKTLAMHLVPNEPPACVPYPSWPTTGRGVLTQVLVIL